MCCNELDEYNHVCVYCKYGLSSHYTSLTYQREGYKDHGRHTSLMHRTLKKEYGETVEKNWSRWNVAPSFVLTSRIH